MKKYLILSSIILAFSVRGQVTLTKAFNCPVLGDVNPKQIYDSVGVVPNTSGANQLWDFSGFSINSSVEVGNYISSSAAGGASYSGTTIVESFDQTYFFMKSTASTYEIVGIQNPNFKLNFSTNTAIKFSWPVAMGYSNTDAFSGTASANNLNGTVSGNITTVAAGTGTLMLPDGNIMPNVLQVKITLTAVAKFGFGLVKAYLNAVDYTYYDATNKFPIVTASYIDATGAYTANAASIKINSSLVGINDYNFNASFNIFPNPAKESFNLNLNNQSQAKAQVEIYNAIGEIIKFVDLGNAAEIINTISTTDLTPGIYMVKTTLGNKASARKLVIE